MRGISRGFSMAGLIFMEIHLPLLPLFWKQRFTSLCPPEISMDLKSLSPLECGITIPRVAEVTHLCYLSENMLSLLYVVCSFTFVHTHFLCVN